jgi:hypothetical protein
VLRLSRNRSCSRCWSLGPAGSAGSSPSATIGVHERAEFGIKPSRKFDKRFARFFMPVMPAGRALEIRFSVVRKRGPEVARRRRRSGVWIRVRAMSRAGHSDCHGGVSAVQTQRGDDHDRPLREQPPTASVRPLVVLQDWPHEQARKRHSKAGIPPPRTLISVRGQLLTRDLRQVAASPRMCAARSVTPHKGLAHNDAQESMVRLSRSALSDRRTPSIAC